MEANLTSCRKKLYSMQNVYTKLVNVYIPWLLIIDIVIDKICLTAVIEWLSFSFLSVFKKKRVVSRELKYLVSNIVVLGHLSEHCPYCHRVILHEWTLDVH